MERSKSNSKVSTEHFPLVDRLHTDVLEGQYGPISSRVIRHDSEIRKAHLVDRKGISRTYAITFLGDNWPDEVKIINEEIKKGTPIGKAFREHEYAIRKNVLEVYILEIPDWLRKEFRVEETHAKARLSEFYAKKRGEEPLIYGIVVEIYSPDFRKPVINKIDIAQESALTQVLKKHGFTKEDIWQGIAKDNDYGDLQSEFEKAKKESDKLEIELKKRIQNELSHQS